MDKRVYLFQVISLNSEILFNICHEDAREVGIFTPTKSLQSHFFRTGR